jgi:hypothetical protein
MHPDKLEGNDHEGWKYGDLRVRGHSLIIPPFRHDFLAAPQPCLVPLISTCIFNVSSINTDTRLG